MRVTEFSIPLPPAPTIAANEEKVASTVARGLNDWRTAGAPPYVPARLVLANAVAAVADAALTRRMHIKSQADPALELPAAQGVRFRLIAEALLSNAVEHAHPSGVIGEIDLRCWRDDNGLLRLDVTDDGVGLPDHFDFTRHGRSGMALIRVLAHQIGADVILKSGACGLQVEVAAPGELIAGK